MFKSLLRNLRPPPANARDPADRGRAARQSAAFITLAPDTTWVRPDADYASSLASMRLRVIAPARALASRVPVAIVPLQRALDDPWLESLGRPGVIVIGKLASSDVVREAEGLRTLTERLQEPRRGTRVFADLSDDYAAYGEESGHPFLAEYQRRLGAACPLIVPCAGLAEAMSSRARHGVHVVEDPWESPQAGAARFAPGPRLRLLWFGNLGPLNASGVGNALAACVRGLVDVPLELAMVTGAHRKPLVQEMAETIRGVHPDILVRFEAWSPEATWRAIADCDVVLLPHDPDAAWSRGKSHNRLVESIRGGRVAVASPIPSYVELSAYAWVNEDLAAGVRWALAQPTQALARVTAGQRHIEGRFDPAVVGRRWCDILGIPTGQA